MRSSSFTILMIVILMIIIVLALIVIIGLALMINTGGGAEPDSGPIFQFVTFAQELLYALFTFMQESFNFLVTQIEKLSRSI